MSVFIVYVLIIIFVLASVRKKNNQARDNRQNRPVNTTARVPASNSMNKKVYKQVNQPKISNNMRNHVRSEKPLQKSWYEDRNNDWLANQMREERIALYRLQDMFSFRMQGRNITDAELLKEFHVEHCDANGVDRAAGK